MVSTTMILIFKRDNSLDQIENDSDCRLGLKESYQQLWKILKLKPIQKFSLLLITWKVSEYIYHISYNCETNSSFSYDDFRWGMEQCSEYLD